MKSSAAMSVRAHPQTSFKATVIDPNGFYGKLRSLYSNVVLKTQLEQMRKQGSYDAFKLKWHPAYDVRRLHGARTRMDGIPPSLFWESDVGKWIEAACYFLSSLDGKSCAHASEFDQCIDELVDMIEKAQQPDGYLDIYFTVVDPKGRFQNLRDMHEMYNAGHLLEGALAHYHYTGSRRFLDVMIKYVECFMQHFGEEPDRKHGYPGHPELELAVLRLYEVTKDPKHYAFGKYLLEARGVKRPDQNNKAYFQYEATVRDDPVHALTMDSLEDQSYNQSHLPLHEQDAILGHSVRAFYLTTAAADLGGSFLDDAKRLLTDAVDNKMYVTGGFGTEPRFEGFSPIPHHLPQSTGEGGCYAETCASIAAMMTSERILSHGLDGKVRDALELCLHNAVFGGGSLDGKAFSYANKMQTWGDEVATRADWFEVCCCPPNLSRTLGMLGGYTWDARVDSGAKKIALNVYLFISAERVIDLRQGQTAKVTMRSDMPWQGKTEWTLEAPQGWTWDLQLPSPAYAENVKVSAAASASTPGFIEIKAEASAKISMTFDMPIRLLAPHIGTGQDTLNVSRGPIIYVAESVDNEQLEAQHTHFDRVGISESIRFEEQQISIEGLPMVGLRAGAGHVYALKEASPAAYRAVDRSQPARLWKRLDQGLVMVPWFARANRGGAGHVRTAFLRADDKALYLNGVAK